MNKNIALLAVLAVGGVMGVGFLGTSIALTVQDFGSSSETALATPIDDATVNFTYDFTSATNTITECNITSNDEIGDGDSVRCQVFDVNGDMLSQGSTTASGAVTAGTVVDVTLDAAQAIDDVESVKVFVIGAEQ